MTIQEFLHDKPFIQTKNVPNGAATTPDELFNNCITVPYPNTSIITSAIIGWHNLLVKYANTDGAILLSRLYEHEGTTGNWNNRRNSLTCSDNYNYAFCSNHFARIIMTMALNGFVPTFQDFWDCMVNKRSLYLSSSVGLTAIEKRISAFCTKKYEKEYYTHGWYLAHIISVNDTPYSVQTPVNIKDIFKLGDEKDWRYDKTTGYIFRKNNDHLRKNP